MATGAGPVSVMNFMVGAANRPTAELARVVQTTTLLPSGAVVSVQIQPTRDGHFVVFDDAAGTADLLALGHLKLGSAELKKAAAIAEQFGLKHGPDGFRAEDVSADQVDVAIVYVAEAARRWAREVLETASRRKQVGILDLVAERVAQVLPFARTTRDRELVGASSKRYSFDLVADLGADRLAIFEIVNPHPNALAASHMKLFDMMGGHPEWPREAIAARLSDWASSDLALISNVASHVRELKSDWQDLKQLAA